MTVADLRHTNKVILHEAASWLAQIDNGELSAEDKLALAEWVNRSPAHVAELRHMSALWAGVDKTIDEAIAEYRPRNIKSFGFLTNILRVKPAYAFTAMTVLILSFFALNLIPFSQQDEGSTTQYVEQSPLVFDVDKGDRLTRTLQDGSIVHLNTDSVIEVKFTDDFRQLNLIRGEALFEVKKDPLRPFRVLAKGKIAEAIGTKFVVRIDSDDLILTVTEGRVKLDVVEHKSNIDSLVIPNDLPSGEPVFLDAGQSASVVGSTLKIAKLEPIDLEHKIAWLDDEFVFSGESLAHVVEEISRYNDVDIFITPSLRDKPIGGRFRTTDVDRILEALELSEGIKVSRSDDGAIYLSQ